MLQVTVYHPSGPRSALVYPEHHKYLCKIIASARGSRTEQIDESIIHIQATHESKLLIRATTIIIQQECGNLCKQGSGSILQAKEYADIHTDFSWEQLRKELSERCPYFLAVLESSASNEAPPTDSLCSRHVMLTAAILLHGRCREMSTVQYLIGFLLTHGGCTQRNIERLSRIGLSTYPLTLLTKLLSWQNILDKDVLSLKEDWKNGSSKKYQLIGDNWDKDILPSYRTSDRNTESLHLFNMYVSVERVCVPPLSSFTKSLQSEEIGTECFIPTVDEQKILKQELVFLLASSIIANDDQMGKLFSRIYSSHLPHKYSDLAGFKTTQYPLGLYDCNENKTQDMIKLMNHLSSTYVRCVDGEIVESVFFGGDRLTDERVQGAQMAVKNVPSEQERLEGLVSKTEDFHRLMNFLEAIHKMTYNTSGKPETGTAYFYRNFLNLRNVKGNVRNSYRAFKLLYYTILDAICVVMFCHHFGTKVGDEIPIPLDFAKLTNPEKVEWLNDVCSSIVNKWFFENKDDIFDKLRDILLDPNHPENYWTSNIENGRIKCHLCNKTFAYVGSLQTHEKTIHKVDVPKSTPKTVDKTADQLHDHVLMLFKLTLLHRNLDTAVDMADGHRSVRSAKYELPIYNLTNKVKYVIGSIHLTAMTTGILPEDQRERLAANRSVNIQGGKNNNIALDEFLEMLNRDSKIACSGRTKESIIRHSKEYPILTNIVERYDSLSGVRTRKGFHHLPSYRTDVLKVAKDLEEADVLTVIPKRTINKKLTQ